MAYDYNSACVHQIPLAIDPNTSHTDDLSSRFATAQCLRNFESCREHILGPMPPNDFIDTFLQALPKADITCRLSSKDAFRAVPSSADNVSDIWQPLVRCWLSNCIPSLTHTRIVVDGFQEEDET